VVRSLACARTPPGFDVGVGQRADFQDAVRTPAKRQVATRISAGQRLFASRIAAGRFIAVMFTG